MSEIKYNIEISDSIIGIKNDIENSLNLSKKGLLMKLIPLFKNLEAIPYELSTKEFESNPENKKYFHIKTKSKIPKSKGNIIKYLVFMPITKKEELTKNDNINNKI